MFFKKQERFSFIGANFSIKVLLDIRLDIEICRVSGWITGKDAGIIRQHQISGSGKLQI